MNDVVPKKMVKRFFLETTLSTGSRRFKFKFPAATQLELDNNSCYMDWVLARQTNGGEPFA